VPVGERAVARECLLARTRPCDDRPQLAPASQAEVERRADALRGERETVPGGIADEEHAILDGAAQLVGDPVSLVALGREAEIVREPDGGVLDVMGRPEGTDSHPQLVAGGEAPRVAGADVAGVDPQLHLWTVALGMDLQATRHARVRWLDGRAIRQHATPTQTIDDQRRTQVPAVAVDDEAVTAGNGGGLELELRALALTPQQRAQLAVVEGRERPGQRPARGAKRSVDDELVEALTQRAAQLERVQPQRGHRAGRGLALADLVTVEHEHPRAAARQLPRDGQAGEAGTADQHVTVPFQRGARLSSLRRSNRHLAGNDTAALRFARCKH
jgi:hypothetical protein